jgi:hypothetical protein
MRWFVNKCRVGFCAASAPLWTLCALMAGAADPERPDSAPGAPAQSREGDARKPQPSEWGSRLNIRPNPGQAGAAGDGAAASKTGASQAKAGEPEKQGPAPLAIPLVQGFDSFGLNLPDYDPEGRLRSLFVIGAISRVDDRNVEIRESFLETYGEDGSPEFSIELPKALLDRFTRVLVANTPVTLRRAEFELKGASLEFNTVTKEGGLGGPVQMTIYSAGPVPSSKQNPDSPQKDRGKAPSAPR